MIDDEENVTMIDFPQMVSVSHRNAQMYFDRDVDCIFKFFEKRFATSAAEGSDVLEESDSDSDDDRRPCFEAIAKSADSLDKALAASGFTEQNQDDLEKFVLGRQIVMMPQVQILKMMQKENHFPRKLCLVVKKLVVWRPKNQFPWRLCLVVKTLVI